MVEMVGVEPTSEKISISLSPSSACFNFRLKFKKHAKQTKNYLVNTFMNTRFFTKVAHLYNDRKDIFVGDIPSPKSLPN